MRGKMFTLLMLCLLPGVTALFAVEVFPGHPRLLIRDQAWGPRSITTDMLVERAKDPRYEPFLKLMHRRGAQNLALRALMTGSREDARAAIDKLLARRGYGSTTDAGPELMWDALAFDWLYNNPEFSEAEKQKVIENLVRGADSCHAMYVNQGTHIFHTRMYAYPQGAAIAGLALKGHHPKADFYADWGYQTYIKDLFPARRLQDGTVHGSMAYGRKYTMWMVGQFIACWTTATGEDLWGMIRREQDDWAWKEALFCIYCEQPDGRMVRFGDNFHRGTERFSFRVISERAHYYDEPTGRDYLNKLLARHAGGTDNRIGTEMGNEYAVFLYWDPDAPAVDYATLPKKMLFSPNGTGMAFCRTGWGPDDTFVFFKCGDYFDNHGHFDAGHVEVFRRVPLLIEAGSYAGGTDSDHYKKFFHQSVSHNTIQIADPSDPEDDGSQRFYNNQGQGSFEKYMSNPLNEYGDIADARDIGGPDLYLAADFTAAYPGGRATSVIRELVWAGERWLVVIDNVGVGDPKFVPRVLWHYTVQPATVSNGFVVADGGARAAVSVLSPADAVINRVEAWKVGTGVYPPQNPSPALGAGRVEVTVEKAGRTDYTFVTVIDIADQDVTPVKASLDVSADGLTVIDLEAGKVILSGEAGKRTRVSFEKN